MTKLRFLSGLTTIGANVVEISTATSRVLMDFGSTENINAMPALATMLSEHSIPDCVELYEPTATKQYEHEAIFISHLHLDHTGALGLLKSDIPVYLSEESTALYNALVASGLSQRNNQLNLQMFRSNKPVEVGDLTVTDLPSDHDILGINALLVSDGQHTFAHSGDFRLNGFHPQLVHQWAEQLKKLNLDVFLTETTSFSFTDEAEKTEFEEPITEKELVTKFIDKLHGTKELQVLNFYERNVERLLAFNAASHENQRPIVWEAAFANLIHLLAPHEPLMVLAESMPTETGHNFANVVPLAGIKAQPEKYCLHSTFANRAWLQQLSPIDYLHCNGAPLGEYDPNYQILRTFLADIDAQYEYWGCSGHATTEDIINICSLVDAQLTIPWHSFHPELFVAKFTNHETLLPNYHQTYEFS